VPLTNSLWCRPWRYRFSDREPRPRSEQSVSHRSSVPWPARPVGKLRPTSRGFSFVSLCRYAVPARAASMRGSFVSASGRGSFAVARSGSGSTCFFGVALSFPGSAAGSAARFGAGSGVDRSTGVSCAGVSRAGLVGVDVSGVEVSDVDVSDVDVSGLGLSPRSTLSASLRSSLPVLRRSASPVVPQGVGGLDASRGRGGPLSPSKY